MTTLFDMIMHNNIKKYQNQTFMKILKDEL